MYIYIKSAKSTFFSLYPWVILGESLGYPLVRSADLLYFVMLRCTSSPISR